MVILASAILTKSGKTLLSRQFVELNKSRIEGLLSAFPKLLGSEKQHTFVETDNVRYLYHPLESLYVLLVTNKTSNILEDLETLHLLAKVVPDYSKSLEEKDILKSAFDIIFAFDEAIAMGYKERVSLQQIKHFTTMLSHDEERFKQEEKSKIIRTKREAERQRKVIEKKKLEDKRMMSGMGGGGYDERHVTNTSFTPTATKQAPDPVIERKTESPRPEPKGRGMQLGKKKEAVYSKVLKEENVPETTENQIPSSTPVPERHGNVHISIMETIALIAQNDGGLQSMEVKGELIITTFDQSFGKVQVHVSQGDNKQYQFKTHPNLNKNLFTEENILALRDQRSYPVSTPSSVLKWRFATTDEKSIPLIINCWPSASGSQVSVPIEYEKTCEFDLNDVTITIPIPGGSPVVGEVAGSTEFDSKKGLLYWRIPVIDKSNKSGSLEFTVPNAPKTAFFPISVSFKSNSTFCAIQAVIVKNEEAEGKTVDFTQESSLTVEQYDIE